MQAWMEDCYSTPVSSVDRKKNYREKTEKTGPGLIFTTNNLSLIQLYVNYLGNGRAVRRHEEDQLAPGNLTHGDAGRRKNQNYAWHI